METEDSNGNFDSRAQVIETPISSPEHTYISTCAEKCTAAAGSSTDSTFGSSVNDLFPSNNRARINARSEGRSSDKRDGASQSPNERVSELFLGRDLRPERFCEGSLPCNGSNRAHSTKTSILSPSCIEQSLVDIGGPTSRPNSLAGALITLSSSKDQAPDYFAKGLASEYPQDNGRSTQSDFITSHQPGPEPTRTRKRLTRANTCIPESNETPETKRPRLKYDNCGFSAEYIIQLSDYVETLLQDGDNMSMMKLFLNIIRDYAAQRYTDETPATVCGRTSNSNFMPSPNNTEQDESHEDTSNTDSSSEDRDESISYQSEPSNNGEHNRICDDESAVGNYSEDNEDCVPYNNGVSKCKRGRWSRLDEARLRAWMKEKQTWSWMAEKLGRTPVTVSNHWKVMSNREAQD